MNTRLAASRLDRAVTGVMAAAEAVIDLGVTRCGRAYIVTAAVLISMVVVVFFAAIIPEVVQSSGWLHAVCHSAWGLFLLGNVAFNYAYCVRTPPGTTADVPKEVLMQASEGGRYCYPCAAPKPAGTHHCHICDRCILKMDHHCPWMNTCVGFANYRYFLLTLFWLAVGAAYSATMTLRRMAAAAAAGGPPMAQAPLPLIFTAVLAAAMCGALSLLLGWHVFLVATAQSTVDFQKNWARAAEARRRGQPWSRPPHPSPRQNFQDVFDVYGRWWWLLWLLPRRAPKQGDGVSCSAAK